MNISLEKSDRPLLRKSVLLTATVYLSQSIFIFTSKNGSLWKDDFVFIVGLSCITWMPVVLGYIATLYQNQKSLTVMQRAASHILGSILFFITFALSTDEESAGYGFLFYFFIFFPIQMLLLFAIEAISAISTTRSQRKKLDLEKLYGSLFIILCTITTTQVLRIPYENYKNIILYSGIFCWFPILISYTFFHFKKIKMQPMELILLFLIADITTVIASTFSLDNSYEISLRLIQSFPLQLFGILIIEVVFLLRRSKIHNS